LKVIKKILKTQRKYKAFGVWAQTFIDSHPAVIPSFFFLSALLLFFVIYFVLCFDFLFCFFSFFLADFFLQNRSTVTVIFSFLPAEPQNKKARHIVVKQKNLKPKKYFGYVSRAKFIAHYQPSNKNNNG